MSEVDYQELGRSKISGKSNFGENVRNDETFDMLKTEINKTSSLEGNTLPDWRQVIAASEKILQEESKDILVGSYLAFAKLEEEGVEGLVDGLNALLGMCDTHWDNMYPPKERLAGRKSAMTWLSSSLETYFTKHSEETFDYERIARLKDTMQTIDKLVSQYDEELSLFKNIKQLDGLTLTDAPAEEAPAKEVKAESEGQAEASKADKAAPAKAAANFDAEIKSDDQAASVLKAVETGLLRLSEFKQKKDPTQTQSYGFKRFAVWAKISKLPKQNEGVTFIEPPKDKDIKQLEDLDKKKKYDKLLALSEKLFVDHPYWLDLQYYTCRAFEGLGKGYEAPILSVQSYLASFLVRCEAIKHFYFLGGKIPFASQDTLDWMEGFLSNDDDEPEIEGDEFDIALAKVDKRSSNTRLDAIISMQHFMGRAIPQVQKLNLLIKTVEVFTKLKEVTCLGGYVKQLSEKVDYFHVIEWDQELGKKALIALISAKQLLGESAEKELDELAMVDIGATIALRKGADEPEPEQQASPKKPDPQPQAQAVEEEEEDEEE